MKLSKEMAQGAPAGSTDFFGSLQRATTELWNGLSANEQENYADIATDWSENAPPNHVQSR